jgi:hypothetical protein
VDRLDFGSPEYITYLEDCFVGIISEAIDETTIPDQLAACQTMKQVLTS